MAEYQNNISVSTQIFNVWDDKGNQLRIAGNGAGLSIAIWVPMIQQDGSRKYPQESRYSCILSPSKVAALDDIIYNNLITKYQEGKSGKMGLFTNVARSTMIEIEVLEGAFYVNLYVKCDPDTCIADKKVTFKFTSYETIISNYDHATGSMEPNFIQVDFFVFAKAVRCYDKMMGGAISGHGGRHTNSFSNREYMDTIRAIATAVHAEIPVHQTNQRPPEPPRSVPAMTTVTDFEDMLN